MRAFVSCDGEAKQIEIFQEPEIISALEAALIDLGKTPASSSAVCQSSDVSPFFLATKKTLLTITQKLYLDIVLQQRIIHDLGDRYTFEKRKQIADALNQVCFNLQNFGKKVFIKTGYAKCGQYPLSLSNALDLCTTKFSTQERGNLETIFPQLVRIYRTAGVVTEDDMTTLGVPNTDDTIYKSIPKDERVLHRQRAVLMTSAHTIAQYRDHTVKTLDRKEKGQELKAFKLMIKDMTDEEKAMHWGFRKLALQQERKARKEQQRHQH